MDKDNEVILKALACFAKRHKIRVFFATPEIYSDCDAAYFFLSMSNMHEDDDWTKNGDEIMVTIHDNNIVIDIVVGDMISGEKTWFNLSEPRSITKAEDFILDFYDITRKKNTIRT